MALKNIIALASILIAAVSCSMEDELISSVANEKQAAADGIALIALNVNTKSVETKAGDGDNSQLLEDETIADTVESCSLIILNNDETVYAAYDGLVVEGGKIKTTAGAAQFLVQAKVPTTGKTFKVMVVANTAQSFAGCANLTAVKAVTLKAADMDKNVKVSQIETKTVTGYATLAEATATPSIFTLVAQQLTAQIQLKEVNVTFKEGTKPVDVKIKDITLVNRSTQSNIAGNIDNKGYDNKTWTINAATYPNGLPVVTTANAAANFASVANADKPSFNTFANATPAAGSETVLSFTLVYDHKSGATKKEFEFIINRPGSIEAGEEFSNNSEHLYIEAGYVYQLVINASLTSNSIDVDALCDVVDWKYNYLEVNMK